MGRAKGDCPTETPQHVHGRPLAYSRQRVCFLFVSRVWEVHSRYAQVAHALEAAVRHSCVARPNANEECAAWHDGSAWPGKPTSCAVMTDPDEAMMEACPVLS